MDRRSFIGTFFAGAIGRWIGAVRPAAAADRDKTLIAVMNSSLRVLDPMLSSASVTRSHGYMIYDTLVALDSKWQVQPQMANWKISDDGLVYTFALRDGLLWHDGAPVTAEDCVASIKRWGAIDSMGQRLRDATASLEATGDKSFVLKLKEKFGLVLECLAKPSTFVAFMMPRRLAETPPGKAMAEQIGSGPFKFAASEFQMNVRVVYLHNVDYKPRAEPPDWASGGKVVKVERVEWQSIPDALTAVNALQAGEIDYLEVPPFDMLPTLEADPRLVVRTVNKVGFQIYGRMNFLHPPFDNLKIRRAALLALDQKDFLEAMVGNPKLYTLCGSIFGCGTPYESGTGADTLVRGNGVAEARQLLRDAGYDGTPVVLIAPTDAVTVKTHPAVAAQLLRDVGFNVDVQPMDAQTWIARGTSQKPPKDGGWNLLFSVFGVMDAFDPIANLYLNSRGLKGGFRGWPEDPTMEALLDEYTHVETNAKRTEIAHKIQARALEQVTYIPLGQVAYPSAWRREWSGVVEFGSPTLFWNIERKV